MSINVVEKQVILNKIYRIFKFGIVGVTGVIVNSGLLYLFTERCKIDYRISSLIAIELSIINNFIWNSSWTWSDKKGSGQKFYLTRFAKFQISTTFVAIINYGVLIGGTEWMKIPYMYSNIAGIVIGSILNFFTGHFWVFKEKALRADTTRGIN